MVTPLISFKTLHKFSLGLIGAIASALLVSVDGVLAQIYQLGDSGPSVEAIQRQLGVSPDGVYGFETEDAVVAFQSRYGLAVDGIAGPETLNALGLSYLTNVGGPTDPFVGSGSGFVTGARSAVVRTSSGIGVNVRNTPNGAQVGGVDDGTRVSLTGRQEFAGGLTWAELAGGGWVATDFLAFDGGVGGPSDPIRPIPPVAQGRYIVAVPGNSPSDLRTARSYVPGAFVDDAFQGAFINAGSYESRSAANSLADRLRDQGLDARVTVRRLR